MWRGSWNNCEWGQFIVMFGRKCGGDKYEGGILLGYRGVVGVKMGTVN